MSFSEFRVIETVGKGSFASVYKVLRKSDNKIYALKRVKINKMSKKEISDALNEIRFLASIRHRNIVGFLQSFLENEETELCIVMEYCGCGDLAQKIERYKRRRQYIDEVVIWRYLVQCLKALQHLHEKGICHRDLKAANTFLAEDGSIKIGDMNVSKKLQQGKLQTQIGTPYYMAPEIWNNRSYDFSADIWSLGCMIYELSSLRPPFTGDSFPSLKRSVTSGRYLPIPKKYSDALSRVLGLMMRLNPKERPSADALLNSSDLSSKLELDEISTSFAPKNGAAQALIETIKVPQNLRRLNVALPKPCYPDMRPNSPSAWTVAEQHKGRPTAGVSLAPISESENIAPSAPATARSAMPTARDDASVASTQSAPPLRKAPKIKLSAPESSRAPLTAVNTNVDPRDRDRGTSYDQAMKNAAGRVAAHRMQQNPQPPAAPLVSQAPGGYNRGRVAGAPSRAQAQAQYRYW